MKAKILLVEDEVIIAMGIEDSLKGSGYDVCGIVSSGEKALDKLQDTQPDLILMDIMISGQLNGIETAEIVHNNYDIPVIFLTALNDETTILNAQKAEPFGYLIKPCDEQDLVAAIEIALARYRKQKAVQCALEKEKELRELKSRFVSILSHEFGNLLNTISVSEQILKMNGRNLPQEKYLKLCDRIEDSVQKMNRFIKELLTIGERESQGFQFQPKMLNIKDLCQNLLDEFREKSGTNYSFQFICENPPSMYLDPQLLGHILTNLLSNAVKYSPNGGEVCLNISWDEQYVYLRVQDQGIGIPEQFQLQLFEPFKRGSNVGKIPSTGLGLAIVKQCVDLHKGKISLESSEGKGTIFTVTLPCVNLKERSLN